MSEDARDAAQIIVAKASADTSVVIKLSLLIALVAEIDRLRDLQGGNRPGLNEVPADLGE